MDFSEFLKRVEYSMGASVYQDGQGRIGIKPIKSAAVSSTRYIRTHRISDFSQTVTRESIYRRVRLYYGYAENNDSWSSVTAENKAAEWNYRSFKELEIYTWLNDANNAQTRATELRDLLDKGTIEFDGPMSLLNHIPGDIIYLTRTRFYNKQGTAWRKLVRILGVQKNIAGRSVRVKAEVVYER